jgi:hypothetical protein
MIRKMNFNGRTFDVEGDTQLQLPGMWHKKDEIYAEVLRLDDHAYENPSVETVEDAINANLSTLYEAGVLTGQYRCVLKRLPGPRDFDVSFTDCYGNSVQDLT